MVLGLPAGEYTIEQRRGTAHARAHIALARGSQSSVSELTVYTPEVGRKKGGEALTEILAGAQVSSPFITGMQWAPGARVALWRALGPVAVRASFDYLALQQNQWVI